ncbi:MAG: DUF2220 family protein [Alphaproteobacteria bacterium]|nr:DUF2220 family protein [Alphaproteobacteria bacterium]
MTDSPDVGVALLEALLERAERNPLAVRPPSSAPDYDLLSTADQVRRFHDVMAAAERAGAIEAVSGRRERRHLIERIRVRDPERLATQLGRLPAPESARRLKEELLPLAGSGEAWVVAMLEDMTARWARREAVFRLASSQTLAAREFFTLLAAISRSEARGLDARTFSLQATRDSKTFDRHASRLAAALRIQLGEPDASADLIWAHIGLERFSHPVHLRGPVAVDGASGRLLDGRARPFASLHPEMLGELALLEAPSAILTIENYASFNRQVREIDDGSLVVYVAGFPAAGVIELLALVLQSVPAAVPFLHWGDVDAGGVRIFRYLEENLPRGPEPHLMTAELAQKSGRPASPDPGLITIAKSDSAVRELAHWLASGSDVFHLEQEALDPQSVHAKR